MLVAATEAGCAGFILKTSPLDELVAAVRTAAAGEIMVSSDLLGGCSTGCTTSTNSPRAT